MTRRFGLEETDIQAVCAIFAVHPQIEKAILYGSRAMGSFKNGSDIDLTLLGGKELTRGTLYLVMEEIDDLLLPYTFDLSIFNDIQDPDVIDHIRRVGVTFYEKSAFPAKPAP